MSSQKQLEANRLNAQHSTGPKTDEGRKRSSQNSLKHGLCTTALLPTENELAYDTFCQEMREDLRPKSPLESMLVERITQLTWRLRRVSAAECEIFNQLDDQRQNKATQAHEAEYRYRENLKIKPSPPVIPPLSSSEHLALTFMNQDDKTNPFHRLKRYESHLQRSLLLCTKELRTQQKYREDHPRTYEEEPPTNNPPQTTNNLQIEPISQSAPEDESGTTNHKPQTTNKFQNEPISPLTPPPTTPCDHPPLTPSNPSYSIPDSPKKQEFSCPTP